MTVLSLANKQLTAKVVGNTYMLIDHGINRSHIEKVDSAILMLSKARAGLHSIQCRVGGSWN